MDKLNLPEYTFRVNNFKDQKWIFDPLRKKKVVLTPEEWVRQNFIQFLIQEKHYPEQLIKVEMGFKVNNLTKRSDILVYDRKGKPSLIVECKAPSVKVSQDVFDQIARYNISLKVDFLVVTNGMEHYCCKINHQKKSYQFLRNIPDFEDLNVD
ncbi:MAG: type I restriction enzyme HsdR N-terminal domain-containing protein [Bacteroidales bacterium]|nr:type I restriction enzyme HsdR N-terminal domain-containing protein [Bacteroidales bacterium]